jgi:hypothetical protein
MHFSIPAAYARMLCSASALVIVVVLPGLTGRLAAAPRPDLAAIARHVAEDDEGFWQRIAAHEPPATMSSRQVFTYALALCQTQQHPERLQRLFELGTRVQDRDPRSPHYGNLKWTWRDAGVTDANAIEFCAEDALRIWLQHRDGVPEPARHVLRELLDYGVEGCLRHRVPTTYTNIALLNAGNLIVLGEALQRPEAAAEGYRRLDAFCLWTWQFGIQEYCSPTYYATDLGGLSMIEEYAARESGRQQARALRELLWTDIALNWFPPAEKLAGPHSRSYDYLRGLGCLDGYLGLNGWLADVNLQGEDVFHWAQSRWTAPPRLHELSLQEFPRLVRQSWGVKPTQSRTHMMYPDITLGCCGEAYGNQDMPLTIDLPGDRNSARCYFIADGREDPYGKHKYETGLSRHRKALHLLPFWAAAQRRRDALGLVLYRQEDLQGGEVTNVQSHFVLRRGVDGFWLGGRKLQVPHGTARKPGRAAIGPGEPLVFRCGTAAVGIRVLWARRQDGRPAAADLVDDDNKYGALRLTIDHHAPEATIEAGAAFWVRIGSGLAGDAAFEAWRKQFEQTMPTTVEANGQSVRLAVPGEEGPLSVTAGKPYGRGPGVALQPLPCRGILELNGREIGRSLLKTIEPVRSHPPRINVLSPLPVPKRDGVYWEAEDGLIFSGLSVGNDGKASAGRYVWQPDDSPVTHLRGSAMWPLSVACGGQYYLWGRTLATTPATHSFYLRLSGPNGEVLLHTTWKLRTENRWQWQPVSIGKSAKPAPLELPAGPCRLELQAREPGTKIDRFMLTPDVLQKPR